MYTCIIVDDQAEAIDLVNDHASKVPQLSVLLKTTDPVAALAFLDNTKPDIIFLDIEMPGITGVEFVENLKAKWGHRMPKVVFTTGYSNYAIQGFEHGVVDYLLKPITFIRFKQCTDRLFDALGILKVPKEAASFFFAENDGKKERVDFDNIVYIEGAGNYIVLGIRGGTMPIYKSMNTMQEILPDSKFMRIHKSYIIAINEIRAVTANEVTVTWNGHDKAFPIGTTFKEDVMKRLRVS